MGLECRRERQHLDTRSEHHPFRNAGGVHALVLLFLYLQKHLIGYGARNCYCFYMMFWDVCTRDVEQSHKLLAGSGRRVSVGGKVLLTFFSIFPCVLNRFSLVSQHPYLIVCLSSFHLASLDRSSCNMECERRCGGLMLAGYKC